MSRSLWIREVNTNRVDVNKSGNEPGPQSPNRRVRSKSRV